MLDKQPLPNQRHISKYGVYAARNWPAMESSKRLFAVIRRYGPPYDPQKPLEAQPEWEAHRVFMNQLEVAGLARLAGPLEETAEVLLIFRAESKEDRSATRSRPVDSLWDPLDRADTTVESAAG